VHHHKNLEKGDMGREKENQEKREGGAHHHWGRTKKEMVGSKGKNNPKQQGPRGDSKDQKHIWGNLYYPGEKRRKTRGWESKIRKPPRKTAERKKRKKKTILERDNPGLRKVTQKLRIREQNIHQKGEECGDGKKTNKGRSSRPVNRMKQKK